VGIKRYALGMRPCVTRMSMPIERAGERNETQCE
jgi:hypothetical protein